MKSIQIDPATFDGKQFAVLYGLRYIRPADFYIQNDKNVSTLFFPDTLPDTPTVAFTMPKSEPQKLAQAIVDAKIHDDVEWDGLGDREALNLLRDVLLKNSALVITGKADPTKIQEATVAAAATDASPASLK